MTLATTPTSALLPEEPVLLVQGRLAHALGLAPALFLQQVHYWLLRSHHEYDGQPWIYNTYSQWQTQFPFLSRDQLARAVAALRRLGVLLVGHWDADRRERRNWYSIDYARLAAVLGAEEEAAPAIADLTDSMPTGSTTILPDPTSALMFGATSAAITASPLLTDMDDTAAVSARPAHDERTPMMQIRTMDDSAVVVHPEITPTEISQRFPQEEDANSARPCPPPPPCQSRSAERGSRNGLAGPGQHPVFSRAAHPPSAPRGAEPQDDDGPLSATHIMSTMFALPPLASTFADHRASRSVPPIPPPSAFRVPTSAFVWGAYRAALDPAAPPALRTRIAADQPNAECGARNAEGGRRRDSPYPQTHQQTYQQTYQRPGGRAGFYPPPPDPAKYAPGGKYGHLFARQTAT
jgi:phage tail protein X